MPFLLNTQYSILNSLLFSLLQIQQKALLLWVGSILYSTEYYWSSKALSRNLSLKPANMKW